MIRRYVFITIENFNRELGGKSLLAKELSSKGLIVFLGHKSIIRSFLKIYPLKEHILIDKGVLKGSKDRISRYKESGMYIYSFDEEALMQTDIKAYSKFNHEIDCIKNIDGIFCWGPKHKQMLKEIGYKNNQLINTGNPRFDVYKEPVKKENDINQKKYILICSRFCMFRAAEMLGFDEDFIKPTKEIYKMFLKIPRFIREAGINNPILIRPHPSEPLNLWEEATKDLNNIKISKEGPVKNILRQSKVMIHNRCTTGIEAYISGVPVISFEPLKLNEPPHPPEELINSFAHFIASSPEEIVKSIKKVYKKNMNLIDQKNNAKKYLFFLNELNYEKITEFILSQHELTPKNSKKPNPLKVIFLLSIIHTYHLFLQILLFFFNKQRYKYIRNKRAKFFLNDEKKFNPKIIKIRFSSIDIFFPSKIKFKDLFY